MNKLRIRLGRTGMNESNDEGLSLIEVIVAMMIFAMVSIGVAYSLVMVLRMTADARGKQTATNLAAEVIDSSRAAANLIDLISHTDVVDVDGRKYTVAVKALWVGTITGADTQCSSGSGALLYKRVNVKVTWAGMSASAAPVYSDTIISPQARVNSAENGVIVVSVINASGGGNEGITITATPNAGTGAIITTTIDPTDAQGCGIVLEVKPGTYVVAISRTGATVPSVDIAQNRTPTATLVVQAGKTYPASFQYDTAGSFAVTTPTGATLPSNLDKSFVSTAGIYTTVANGPYLLHPKLEYSVIAGKLAPSGSTAVACASLDPVLWLATTGAKARLAGVRPPTVSAQPGGTAPVAAVPMGVTKITGLDSSNKYIKAVQQAAPPAGVYDPGCAAPSTYIYGPFTVADNKTAVTIALPYGSWALTKGATASSATGGFGESDVAFQTPGSAKAVSGTLIVTADPRLVAP